MISTPERLLQAMKKTPWDVLINIRPVRHAEPPSNPALVPVLFQDDGITYLGWTMRGTLPAMFDCEYDELWLPNVNRTFTSSSTGNVYTVNDANFEQEVLASHIPVLVNFWAPWAGPCRMAASVVDEIAEQYVGQGKVVKLNTDENPNVVSQYGIRVIPTLMIFKGGQRVDVVVGAVPKTTLVNVFKKYL
jgi:thioredoxin 1